MKLLYFTAPWCAPCKTMRPLVDEIDADTPLEVEVVDIDTDPTRAAQHGVRSVPTLILQSRNGMTVRTLRGAASRAALHEFLWGAP